MYSLKRVCNKVLGSISKKTLMLILALTVTIVTAAGGTLAYMYGTQQVKNTFSYGDIVIDLEESDSGLDEDENPDTNEYEMMPGQDISKDPAVTVLAGSMNCWLFVEIRESANFADFMTYTVAQGWLPLENVPGVYYREVDTAAEAQIFPVLEGNVVHMKDSVTMGMLSNLTDADYPTLTFMAYAVQRDAKITDVATASSAWNIVSNVQ